VAELVAETVGPLLVSAVLRWEWQKGRHREKEEREREREMKDEKQRKT
jgi:hypothetical protein